MNIQNSRLFQDNPFMDTGQKKRLQVLRTVMPMTDNEAKKNLLYFLTNTKGDKTKELVELLYEYRDTFEYECTGFKTLDKLITNLEN